MSPEEVYGYYENNWSRAARELKLGKNTTAYWNKIGYIPMPMQIKIQKLTRGKLIADVNKNKEK